MTTHGAALSSEPVQGRDAARLLDSLDCRAGHTSVEAVAP